ncbi:MAG: hypothetical protein EXR72_09725 [Myxococcales bacterium]|nr:hypothetical protein [Myxococcales bacterium]
MSPEEICRRLGEEKVKVIFHELTTDTMKKVLREAKIPTTRLASHTSSRKRNDDWAARLWRAVAEKPLTTTAATLLFEWLTRGRRPMLAEFLTAIDVKHEGGLTDADFMTTVAKEKLCEAGQALLDGGHHDRREVAAYLLFLDASNKSEGFAPLDLEGVLGASPLPVAQAT